MSISKELLSDLNRKDMFERAKAHLKTIDSSKTAYLPEEMLDTDALKNDINICMHTEHSNGFYHTHEFFELIYVYQGFVVDDVDGKCIELNRGDAVIHNPAATHAIVKFQDNADILINILISRDTFKKVLFNLLFDNEKLNAFFSERQIEGENCNYIMFSGSPELERIIDILMEEFYKKEKASQIVLKSTVMLLLGTILREYEKKSRDNFSDEVIEYVNLNLKYATLEETANHFGYHPKYFSALLSQKMHISFKEILIDLRIKKAAQLLKGSDLTIDEITRDVGYKDKSSLYAHFKRYYGVTPVQYRND